MKQLILNDKDLRDVKICNFEGCPLYMRGTCISLRIEPSKCENRKREGKKMKQLILNDKDLRKLLIILKNSYTIDNNKYALILYTDLKNQAGLSK